MIQVLAELRAAPRPHTLEFMRYDMRFSRLTLQWETLEDIRRQGKYVRDAREEVGDAVKLRDQSFSFVYFPQVQYE